jgi:hypothetical protein
MGVVRDTERGGLRGRVCGGSATATQTGAAPPPTGRALYLRPATAGVGCPGGAAAETRPAGRPCPVVRPRCHEQDRPYSRLCGRPEEGAADCRPDAPRPSCARRGGSGAIREGRPRPLSGGGDRGPAATGGRPDVSHPRGPFALGVRTSPDRLVQAARAVAYLEFLRVLHCTTKVPRPPRNIADLQTLARNRPNVAGSSGPQRLAARKGGLGSGALQSLSGGERCTDLIETRGEPHAQAIGRRWRPSCFSVRVSDQSGEAHRDRGCGYRRNIMAAGGRDRERGKRQSSKNCCRRRGRHPQSPPPEYFSGRAGHKEAETAAAAITRGLHRSWSGPGCLHALWQTRTGSPSRVEVLRHGWQTLRHLSRLLEQEVRVRGSRRSYKVHGPNDHVLLERQTHLAFPVRRRDSQTHLSANARRETIGGKLRAPPHKPGKGRSTQSPAGFAWGGGRPPPPARTSTGGL